MGLPEDSGMFPRNVEFRDDKIAPDGPADFVTVVSDFAGGQAKTEGN